MYSVCLCPVASASNLNDITFWYKNKNKLAASLLVHHRLLLEVARATILLDNLHGGVVLEVSHGGTLPLAVSHLSDRAVPGGSEAGLGVEQSHG